MAERQIGGLGAQVDATITSTPGSQVGGIGLLVEGPLPTGVNFGWLGAMVDVFVSLVPAAAVRWSGTTFETGTSSPLVYWSSGAFQSSGTSIVIWNTDHFEMVI